MLGVYFRRSVNPYATSLVFLATNRLSQIFSVLSILSDGCPVRRITDLVALLVLFAVRRINLNLKETPGGATSAVSHSASAVEKKKQKDGGKSKRE